MTTIESAATTIREPVAGFEFDEAQLAAVSFLARYSGRTLEAYRHDLRGFFQWATDTGIAALEASRAHIELFRAWMEDRGLAASTIDRRLSTVCGFYRFAHLDGRIRSNPAQYVRQPQVHASDARGLDRSELGVFLLTAERYDRDHAALAVLLGLNGLRVSEACATNVEDLGFERGHRTLRIMGKGNKPATVPLVPRTARTIDLAVGERHEGPRLLSIFAGSFALDAAEAVAAGEPVLPDDIVDIIDRLVSRSLLVPVGDVEETRFRLLEPIRHLATERLDDRGETDSVRHAHAHWYLDLIVRLGERWRAGDDQGTWPIAARELPNLRVAFDHLVTAGRVDDAQRFAVLGHCPIGWHFDSVPWYDWAPRAGSLDPDHVGPWTASVCAVAAWGAAIQDDLLGAAAWLRRGVSAIEAGSTDEGLLAVAAMHHVLSGGELAVSDAFLDRSVQAALHGGDLYRAVWVLDYAGRSEEALDAAMRLGNKVLIATARFTAIVGRRASDELVESFWEAAQQSHSYLMLNHAAMEVGAAEIRAGAPLDGLLLLRSPARDWLLRADWRVWSVLHSMAIGFVALGDVETAARLAGAIGDRRLPFVSDRRQALLRSQLDASVDGVARARHETAGGALDAGAAVAEALERIDALATLSSNNAAESDGDPSHLTARQLEVAMLVA
jgi:integrase/recombinase XerD